MSEIITVVVMALGVAADAFAVAVCNSMTKRLTKIQFVSYPICFAVFQGLMPLLGYFIGSAFLEWVAMLDHWIALVLLSVIGAKMIYESAKIIRHGKSNGTETAPSKVSSFNFSEMILQGISTSIDAMVVGITLALTVYMNIFYSVLIIAVITFAVCLAGMFLGKRAGKLFSDYAGVVGGIVLIGIGVKIFVEHIVQNIGAI